MPDEWLVGAFIFTSEVIWCSIRLLLFAVFIETDFFH